MGIEKTTDIKLLGKLANLEKLSLEILPEYEVVDLSWIPALQELRELSIRSSTIDDVSPLAELPKLTEIDFDRTKIKDISPLLKSKTLKKVTGFVLENDDTELRSLFEKRGIEYWKFSSDH
jgi:Leucine-rich repeat (LRR) protein